MHPARLRFRNQAALTRETPHPLPPDLAHLHEKKCVVATHQGTAVGTGTLMVANFPLVPGAVRLDLYVETEKTACVIGIARSRIPELTASWDGATYRYTLPPGSTEWLIDGARPSPPASDPS